MRLFIAINPESQIRNEIFSATEPLRNIPVGARWVAPELLHLTVKFLGNRNEEEAGRVSALLDNVTALYRTISYGISGVGAFPNLRRPGVVWMGVQADSKLELLNHDIEKACSEIGIPVEGRPFRPHITIGRIERPTQPALRDFASVCGNISYRSETQVTSIDLMLSHHKDQRLTYSVLHSSFLRK